MPIYLHSMKSACNMKILTCTNQNNMHSWCGPGQHDPHFMSPLENILEALSIHIHHPLTIHDDGIYSLPNWSNSVSVMRDSGLGWCVLGNLGNPPKSGSSESWINNMHSTFPEFGESSYSISFFPPPPILSFSLLALLHWSAHLFIFCFHIFSHAILYNN